MKKFTRILSAVVIIILVLCLALLSIPKLFGVRFFSVESRSMEPEIQKDSLVVVVPAEYEDIKVGDDISFVLDESLKIVTHRVIEKNDAEMTVTTQGIANNMADQPTRYENVIGVVRVNIPVLGHLFIYLSTLQGKVIAFTVIIALLIVSVLFSKLFDKKNNNKKY